MVELKIRLDEKVRAKMPFQANPTDSGYDLTATSVEWNDKDAKLIYHTGVYLNIPTGYEVIITPRSSTSKYELFMPHSEGLIDESYNKELLVVYKIIGINKNTIEWAKLDDLGKLTILIEYAKYPYSPLTYRAGDVVAQMRMQKKTEYRLVQTDKIVDSGREGFGSSNSYNMSHIVEPMRKYIDKADDLVWKTNG